ncbi:cytochrome c-type biogenesis protein CcmH/NrfF [Thermocatellispora tengchongensis]|uniref:Cytochrome c-type biogenesis protein CcmH/NrfF n=1 Tax=Thermocatellispora tengchongensis TaxID=1073253 RepID=A0A840NTV8_9ACTN|nr:cytochrome c-type biogenesis protein CcmH/NrfF [Thermocatellispora tengchongensis]
MAIGITEALILLVAWVVPGVALFFLIYWAVRLAIRHERRQVPSLREATHQERQSRGIENAPDGL